jgi:hypothetical protein
MVVRREREREREREGGREGGRNIAISTYGNFLCHIKFTHP